MILMRIDDFKCKPSITEYLLLYTTSSTFLIVSSAAIFGELSATWAWLSFAILLMSTAVLNLLKQIRMQRAQKFYQEWLSALDSNEVSELRNRLKAQCPEHALINNFTKD